MSNYYLCETCRNRSDNSLFPCKVRPRLQHKVAFIDKGHHSKPSDYCKEYREEKDNANS